jgi:ATP-dependent DNA ligase
VCFFAFNILEDAGKKTRDLPLFERRRRLERLLGPAVALDGAAPKERAGTVISIVPRPPTTPRRSAGSTGLADAGCEGVVAKRPDEPYLAGERGWLKVRRRTSMDFVLGGYCPHGERVSSLLLGLCNGAGLLGYVGRTMPLPAELGDAIRRPLLELEGTDGFTGVRPGAIGRFASDRGFDWVPLAPLLVVECAVDGIEFGQIRHRARLLRFRPDRRPESCRWAG